MRFLNSLVGTNECLILIFDPHSRSVSKLKNRTFNKQIGHKKERHGALD